jgi:hypothetical protein
MEEIVGVSEREIGLADGTVRIPCCGDFAAGEHGVLRLRICVASQPRYFAQDDKVFIDGERVGAES